MNTGKHLSDYKIIQKVMGWEDYHLFEFYDKKTKISKSRVISDIIERKGQKIGYLYDMGDPWEHKLTVKKIFEVEDDENNFPVVLEGERACPLEDCGGIWGISGTS